MYLTTTREADRAMPSPTEPASRRQGGNGVPHAIVRLFIWCTFLQNWRVFGRQQVEPHNCAAEESLYCRHAPHPLFCLALSNKTLSPGCEIIVEKLRTVNQASEGNAFRPLNRTQHWIDYVSSVFCKQKSEDIVALGKIISDRPMIQTMHPTALIIGANKGATTGDLRKTTDPSFFKLMTNPSFQNWNKVFIEPIPPIYQILKRNVDAFNDKRATTINAAIVSHKEPNIENTRMYCWKLTKDGGLDVALFKLVNLPHAEWMGGTCSMDKSRLFHKHDFKFASKFSEEQKALLVDTFKVNISTVNEVLSSVGMSHEPVLYVQIDAEGYDAKLLLSMPWHLDEFRPILIEYEYILLSKSEIDSLKKFLENRGYKLIDGDAQNHIWGKREC